MNRELPPPPSFTRTVRLLLGAARIRAAGQRRRQQQLFRQRAGKPTTDWGGLGTALTLLFMIIINVVAAFALAVAITSAERNEAERQGKVVVSQAFIDSARKAEEIAQTTPGTPDLFVAPGVYSSEAETIADRHGGTQQVIEQKLRDAVHNHGSQNLVTSKEAAPGVSSFAKIGLLPSMLGSLFLIGWGAMLVFQGEGLELDLQRRRHPMWEWLLSHPVPPGAVFLAQMLSPIAANPLYWVAPIFVGIVYNFIYDPALGLLAAFVIGVPVTIAAACLGKALEIGVILRFPPRSRGAMVGIMSWLGFAAMMGSFVSIFLVPQLAPAVWKFFYIFTVLPWPWLRLFLGGLPDGSFSFLAGMFTCWGAAVATIVGAVWFSVWGTNQGLSGNVGAADTRPVPSKGKASFGKEPLYRKEALWFMRDRSAIVQTILIPLTVASYQVFNLRYFLSHAQGAWNYLCGIGILFGTYFLWILGPKSLSSEGTALWIAMTWPRGLESLLKAKAWLWSLISSGMVALVLCYAVFLFPDSIWKVGLVGVGWFVFSRSMAEKTVTLVTVTSESGEPQKISRGRQWAAQLGMLTFAIGVCTQQWHLAIVGIVYSYITAAAMWESFRARLPYLYDPWSEELPPPPTLMHAMIAISILIEAVAVLTGIFVAVLGPDDIAAAQSMAYAICAVLVSVGTANFLNGRDVTVRDIWRWSAAQAKPDSWLGGDASRTTFLRMLLLGTGGGVALGLLAHSYLTVLWHFPITAELLNKTQEQLATMPGLRISYAVMAIGFAPFAEEYLFRGLLFRALDREWGGWRAVVGSAAFFAIYHPPLAWLPVGLLGAINALLFKKTGRLLPAVVVHIVYNAVVLLW